MLISDGAYYPKISTAGTAGTLSRFYRLNQKAIVEQYVAN